MADSQRVSDEAVEMRIRAKKDGISNFARDLRDARAENIRLDVALDEALRIHLDL